MPGKGMPTPMTAPALAGAGAMDQVPMLRAAAVRAAIQRRECSEIFLTLSMFRLRAEELWTPRAIYGQNMQAHPPRQLPTHAMTPAWRVLQCCSVREGSSKELISLGKAGFGTAPLVRYTVEPKYHLPNHNVDNEHQECRMGIHR